MTGLKHGAARKETLPIYRVWNTMKARCYNETSEMYASYGGRGIAICDEWGDPVAFVEWALRSGYRAGLSIDRRDVNGNYEPTNCHWIPMADQHHNKTNNCWIEYRGERKTLTQWAREYGLHHTVVHGRLNRCGWSIHKALNTPKLWGKAKEARSC